MTSYRRALTSATVLLFLSGCMATESQRGDVFVYKKTILFSLALLAIAITMIVFGVGIFRESREAHNKRQRKKKKRPQRGPEGRRRESAPPEPEKKTPWGMFVGSGLCVGGVLILVLGVPSSFVQHITIHPDKVEMRLSVMWFSKGTREIPFSSISQIEKQEEQVMARRGRRTKETMILHLNSGTERFEMGPLEKAAFPKLVERLQAYRDAGGQVADPQIAANDPDGIPPGLIDEGGVFDMGKGNPPIPPVENPAQKTQTQVQPIPPKNNTPPTVASTDGKLTPTRFLGRLYSGSDAMAKRPEGGFGKATVLAVYAEGKVKIRRYGAPAGTSELLDAADVRPGTLGYLPPNFGPGTAVDPSNAPIGSKVLCFHGGRWFEAELLEVSGTRAKVRWKGERNRSGVILKYVRIPPPEGLEPYVGARYKPKDDSGLTKVNSFGSYKPGSAHYVSEGETSRKVILVQAYQGNLYKVRDAETDEELYVFQFEMRDNP